MTNPPLFSIIMPTYNRAAMLRAAIKSVLAQTFESWECFVLDDGSTDATPAVYEEFKDHPRLRLHRFEDNKRQHVRRNFAMKMAHGEWITFLDSDDLWLPERLEAFAKAAQARPSADFWFSNAYHLRYRRIVGKVFDERRPIPEGRVPGWYAAGDKYLPYLTSNLSVRKAAFDTIGHFREDMKILEDTELYARMLASGVRVGVIRKPVAIRRLHEAQITHDYSVDYDESLIALKSGGAPDDVLSEARKALALEFSTYFVKGVQPENMHAFLRKHVTDRGLGYWKVLLLGLVPRFLIRFAKHVRTLYLFTRYSRLLAPAEYDEVRRHVENLESRIENQESR